jgi:eukaryotic-like serine/threonine-protein kinase
MTGQVISRHSYFNKFSKNGSHSIIRKYIVNPGHCEAFMIGKAISHYSIIEKLGEGGMGVVYKAQDTKLDRLVALKFLPLNLTASQEEIARFEQEARAISALNHPNIETIYDVDETEGQKYLVLEYIPGGTLKSRLKQLKSKDKGFSLGEVINYGIQMAEGLAHAHRRQIIHRDVKTENIMLTEEGKIKLTDFGLAKLRGSVQHTKTGSTLGTAAYMSPEQVRGEEVDQRSDIFSLGVVLYELATSHLPFQGEYEAAMSYSTLNENPPPINSMRQDSPRQLEKIINQCLEKDKNKRYQNADEIVSDLRTVQQEISRTVTSSTKQSKVPWLVAAMVVVLAVAGITLFHSKSTPLSAKSKTIAVLPFNNLSENKEDEYFSDGIMEDILTQLSKIADLNVISRTTVMQYKGTKKTLKEIGKELNAGVVLEGSVRRSGDRIRIASQLIDAEADRHLWAETYDRDMKDVFAIQSDVANEIAAALKAKLSPAEKERIEKKQTENMEAYQFYLKGRFYWNKRTATDLQKAIDNFNQAIEQDPNYALAYAGLASTFVILPEYSSFSPKEVIPKAEAAVKKALALDGSLAEAHAVLGIIKTNYDWDWDGAESEYRKAIELNPNYPTAHHWYYVHLSCLCRFDEAFSEIKRAQVLDPLSVIINDNVGEALYLMRRYDEALDQFNKTLELDPNHPITHEYLGLIYLTQGKSDQAIAELQKVRAAVGNTPFGLGPLGDAYAMAGKKNDAIRILNELFEFSKQGYSVSGDIVLVYYGLRNKEKVFEWLDKAYQERNIGLLSLKAFPFWDEYRSDPRFIALLKKIGLEK